MTRAFVAARLILRVEYSGGKPRSGVHGLVGSAQAYNDLVAVASGA